MARQDDIRGIRRTIRVLRKDGWELDFVYDGEEDVEVSTEAAAIEAATAVDDAYLNVRRGDDTGWVRFVLGNSPGEVLCDYTNNLTVLDDLDLIEEAEARR